jgi:hypothetical protein
MTEDWRPRLLSRNRPQLGGGVAVLFLVAVVALGSNSRVGSGGPPVRMPAGWLLLALAGVAMTVLAAGFLAAGYASGAGTRRTTKVVALVVSGALGFVFLTFLIFGPGAYDRNTQGPGFSCLHRTLPFRQVDYDKVCRHLHQTAAGEVRRGSRGSGPGSATAMAVAGAAVALAVLVLVGAMLASRRRRGEEELGAKEEDAVLRALDESLDDLRSERDVRRAIIACYARMERALSRSGAARMVQEAPFEYLTRILGRVASAGPAVRALTELFERAKFSIEPMGPQEKEQAIAALEKLRTEVYA